MKLKIPGIGRRKATGAQKKTPANPVVSERDEALRRMRDRVTEARPAADPETPVAPAELQPPPPPPDPLQAIKPSAEPAGPDPLPDPEPAAGDSTDGAAGSESDPLKGLAEAGSGVDSDLLDLFMEAKAETDEASLAAELEDVEISDLLGEVLQVGNRLGLKTEGLAQARAAKPAAPGMAADSRSPETGHTAAKPVKIEVAGKETEEIGPTIETPDEPAAIEEDIDLDAILATTRQTVPAPGDEPDNAVDPVEETPGITVRRVDPAENTIAKASPGRNLNGIYFGVVGVVGLGLAMTTGLGVSMAKESDAPDASSVLSIVAMPAEPAVGTATIVHPENLAPQVGEAAAATPVATPSAVVVAAAPPAQLQVAEFAEDQPPYFMYTVEAGDSLTSIAIANGICPDHILWNNDLPDGALLAGDQLRLPGHTGVLHDVRPGDSIGELAERYNTTREAILAYSGNGLRSDADLKPGSVILLPNAFPQSVLQQTSEEKAAYTQTSEHGYIWPFYGPITTYYGEQRPGYVHTAIDVGGLGRWGAPVISIAAGRVVAAVYGHPGLGNYVVVVHEDGSRSLYAHLASISVEQGDLLRIASPLGALGCTGYSTGTHLHFELWRDGAPVDPLIYLTVPGAEDARQANGAE